MTNDGTIPGSKKARTQYETAQRKARRAAKDAQIEKELRASYSGLPKMEKMTFARLGAIVNGKE